MKNWRKTIVKFFTKKVLPKRGIKITHVDKRHRRNSRPGYLSKYVTRKETGNDS